ncbi:MAG: hypothetical protein MMC33_008735 [Icmadophila ericetorum]|nr:hypothetical protein [Icmadophila ericetorum]
MGLPIASFTSSPSSTTSTAPVKTPSTVELSPLPQPRQLRSIPISTRFPPTRVSIPIVRGSTYTSNFPAGSAVSSSSAGPSSSSSTIFPITSTSTSTSNIPPAGPTSSASASTSTTTSPAAAPTHQITFDEALSCIRTLETYEQQQGDDSWEMRQTFDLMKRLIELHRRVKDERERERGREGQRAGRLMAERELERVIIG